MGRRAQRAEEAKHRADRIFLAYLRTATIVQLGELQIRFVNAKLWKRVAIARAIARHWAQHVGNP